MMISELLRTVEPVVRTVQPILRVVVWVMIIRQESRILLRNLRSRKHTHEHLEGVKSHFEKLRADLDGLVTKASSRALADFEKMDHRELHTLLRQVSLPSAVRHALVNAVRAYKRAERACTLARRWEETAKYVPLCVIVFEAAWKTKWAIDATEQAEKALEQAAIATNQEQPVAPQ